MFVLKVNDAKRLRDLLVAASAVVDEGTFNLSPDGITMRGMDGSRVSLVDLAMPAAMFEKYECPSTSKLCVRLDELLRILRRAGKDEPIELRADRERLQVRLLGKCYREFTMPTLTAQEAEVPAPKLAFDATAKVLTGYLNAAIDDISLVGDSVTIEAKEEGLVFTTSSELFGGTVVFNRGSEPLVELGVKNPSKASFSISHLARIVKNAAAVSETVVMEFSNDMPLRLDFQQENGGRLVFFLAPRIES